MTENDQKQLNDQEIEQVSGGEGGGATGTWPKYVCPVCHGDVIPVRTMPMNSCHITIKYGCNTCGHLWLQKELIEEQ